MAHLFLWETGGCCADVWMSKDPGVHVIAFAVDELGRNRFRVRFPEVLVHLYGCDKLLSIKVEHITNPPLDLPAYLG